MLTKKIQLTAEQINFYKTNGYLLVQNFINLLTSHLDNTHEFKRHLINSVPYFRYIIMGIGLLFIMRYRPKGLLPEKIKLQKI